MRQSVRLGLVAALVVLAPLARAQSGAAGAVGQTEDTVVAGPFDGAVGVAFDHHGTMFVWERTGLVWTVDAQGVRSTNPVLDLSEEVGSWGDHGLLGFALDPDLDSTGRIYLCYVVDYHHLTKFGTPAYDPQANEYGLDTIARVARYTLLDPHDAAQGVDPASRVVLVGDAISNGIPVCGTSHTGGALLFGEDGTLLVTTGDGYSLTGAGNCLADGIIQPKEDVERWRSQLVDSHSGKLLRIDPATGAGLSSNPWYDPLAPSAPRSRVWALGFRNPFRMALRPGSGNPDPAVGDPGTVFVGDVGSSLQEELNVVTEGGLNFGWPYFEGFVPHPAQFQQTFVNADAPNPLFGQVVPGVGTCNQTHFRFSQLLVQEALAPLPPTNPCDPAQAVPPALVQVHTAPELGWAHEGSARVKNFNAQGGLEPKILGAPGSPVPGVSFEGNCAIAGVWYTGTDFPVAYQDTLFFADLGRNWIRSASFDATDRLTLVQDFAGGVGSIVSLATSPVTGALYYVNLYDDDAGSKATVHRITFTGNAAPSAVAAPGVVWGPEPLEVAFDATASSDPEGGALSFEWDFGDGTPKSRNPAPVHVFPSTDVSAAGAVLTRLSELPPTPPPYPLTPPGVLKDNFYPPPGTTDITTVLHTAHVNAQGQPDKNGVDWIGYVYTQPWTFLGLVFQEGMHLTPIGGWFETLDVQIRDHRTGLWSSVADLEIWPPFEGLNATGFEVFEMRFTPRLGNGIRVIGAPGGTEEFVTAGELRAIVAPRLPVGIPKSYSVTLEATDDVNQGAPTQVLVSINNTPPVPTISSPKNGRTFSNAVPTLIDLVATAFDAEHQPSEVQCEWRVILHHDNHVHPDDPIPACTGQALLLPHGLDGDAIYYELAFTATDAVGLSAQKSHWLVPEDDQNLNGEDDLQDILLGVSLDLNGNFVPDECERDCNRDGASDVLEIVAGLDHDCNANGIPDGCETLPDCDGDGTADPCMIVLHGANDLNGDGVPDDCLVALDPALGKQKL